MIAPIGRYAACLALLVLGRDYEASVIAASIEGRDDFPTDVAESLAALADGLRARDDFPAPVADALAYIAAENTLGYIDAVEAVLESFETREDYLEDIPVADTVLVLQGMAAARGFAVELRSPLLTA